MKYQIFYITDESDEDEEFFDCNMDEERESSTERDYKDTETLPKKPQHSLWNKPVGRSRRHGNMRLLQTGEYLYVPVTQVNLIPCLQRMLFNVTC